MYVHQTLHPSREVREVGAGSNAHTIKYILFRYVISTCFCISEKAMKIYKNSSVIRLSDSEFNLWEGVSLQVRELGRIRSVKLLVRNWLVLLSAFQFYHNQIKLLDDWGSPEITNLQLYKSSQSGGVRSKICGKFVECKPFKNPQIIGGVPARPKKAPKMDEKVAFLYIDCSHRRDCNYWEAKTMTK